MVDLARSFNEVFPRVDDGVLAIHYHAPAIGLLPGDDLISTVIVRRITRTSTVGARTPGENEHWCRPGKPWHQRHAEGRGVLLFSSNAAPFEPVAPIPRSRSTRYWSTTAISRAATALRARVLARAIPASQPVQFMTTDGAVDDGLSRSGTAPR